MSEVFRLKVGVKYSEGGSGGDWRYFENVDELKVSLLAAHLDVLAKPVRPTFRSRMARMWRGDKPTYPRVDAVLAVDRHTDSGWVPVEYEIVAPDVCLPAARTQQERGTDHE